MSRSDPRRIVLSSATELGRQNALRALLGRRIELARVARTHAPAPAHDASVHRAYAEARQQLMERHAERFDFRF
jgi:hypothetical protein